MKLTENQINRINKIRELRRTKTPSEIARELNIPKSTVIYWYHDKARERSKEYKRNYEKKLYYSKTLEQRRTERKTKLEYQRNYHKKRYKEDKEFREKQIKSSVRSRKKQREMKNE